MQALVSYKWGHAQDDDSTGITLRAPAYGDAHFDVRHNIAAAVIYELATLHASAPARLAMEHWPIDLIVHAQSAIPVDLVARTVAEPTTGVLTDVRPNVVPGVPVYIHDASAPVGSRINARAFSIPPVGQSGNPGRNVLRRLPTYQVDLALRRSIPLKTGLGLQLRAEAFNVFNHPHFGTIQTLLSATNFGEPTSMLNAQLGGLSPLYQIGGPRSLQFTLKLAF